MCTVKSGNKQSLWIAVYHEIGGISTTSNPKALDADRTMLEVTGQHYNASEKLGRQGKDEKTIYYALVMELRTSCQTQTLMVAIPCRFESCQGQLSSNINLYVVDSISSQNDETNGC